MDPEGAQPPPETAVDTDRREDEALGLVARLAALMAAAERAEEAQARTHTGSGTTPVGASARASGRRRALLLANPRAGRLAAHPAALDGLVERLGLHGVDAEVRAGLGADEAQAAARAAAVAGYPLVIAVGGDGTVEGTAAALVGTRATLGIIPLGTYNNVAGSLGVPNDPEAACDLIGVGPVRTVDVGEVRLDGGVPRLFLESAAVGLAASLLPAGEAAKGGRWTPLVADVSHALLSRPALTKVGLDGEAPSGHSNSLLVHIANTPRTATALMAAPRARMDDGLLDILVYREMGPAELGRCFLELEAHVAPADKRITWARARRVEVHTEPPLPVSADGTVIGTTPVSIRILPGALRVIAGDGVGLIRPVSPALVAALSRR